MAEIHPFPPRPAPPPSLLKGMPEEAAAAMALLSAVRLRQPRFPGDSDAEHELEVFATAIQRLTSVRPVADIPDALQVAALDEALVMAELVGQLLRSLDGRRQVAAIPIVLQGLIEALQSGPELRA
jgi:hypothetical protein